MKTFTRIEPTTIQEVGDHFKDYVIIKRFRTEDGLEHEFTTFNKEDAVCAGVIALTTDNQVIVARQFRPNREAYCDDLPGGRVNSGETPEAAARRELLEETGYKPGSMSYLGDYLWDGYRNLTAHYFLARDCVFASKPQRNQTEIDQGMETALISIDKLIENAKSNKTSDAVAILMAYDTLKALEGGE